VTYEPEFLNLEDVLNGNKRTGLVAALVFLDLNGITSARIQRTRLTQI